MVVQHRSGSKYENSDALSRIAPPLSACPSYVTGIKPRDLPCRGCQYCTKADEQWGSFTKEVDNAIGLSTGGNFSFANVHVIQETCPVAPHGKPSARSGPKQSPQHGGRVWEPGGQVSECIVRSEQLKTDMHAEVLRKSCN
ncbi:hypothetical protein DPMN_084297 [Dreissena polymorpha]|uniref:Uncharacterized protein n=1 Tax=Dreissena polymorpha TaxID=45954 RepID=A0A9D4BJ92_DREPO|nr:hypothetical protein DPMN_084297 [Dreissena polymorpha]